MKSFIKYWLPVLIWLGVMFIGSGDLMSAEHTSRIIGPFLRWLKPDISLQTIELVQMFVRKTAHLTEYAIVALLLIRALRGGMNTNKAKRMPMLYASAWVAATILAGFDEYHQSFVGSRGSAWWDVMIDSGGAIFGLLIYNWRISRSQKGDAESRIERFSD